MNWLLPKQSEDEDTGMNNITTLINAKEKYKCIIHSTEFILALCTIFPGFNTLRSIKSIKYSSPGQEFKISS